MVTAPPQPSLAALRVRFIQDALRKQGNVSRICVAATGKTHTGKSTLGNRLIGQNYFLKSDGHQDCTDEVTIVRFSAGLTYVDLPGVASDDEYENYNRVALGLKQTPEWPQVSRLKTTTYHDDRWHEVREYSPIEIERGVVSPDLIFYLIAPHHLLSSRDVNYMTALLHQFGPERVILVLNHFVSKQSLTERIATPQNLADVYKVIHGVFQNLNLEATLSIVEVNCWTGDNFDALFDCARSQLGTKQGAVFAEVMAYQQSQTPVAYWQEVQLSLLHLLAEIALQKPSAEDDIATLQHSLDQALAYFERVTNTSVTLSRATRASLKHLMLRITKFCTRHVTEPILKQKSRRIYVKEPYYEYVEEPDYDKPIYRWKTVRRRPKGWLERAQAFLSDGWIKEEKRVKDGYEMRRRRIVRNRRVYSHTETWLEDTGRRRVIDTFYQSYGVRGVALLATAVELAAHPGRRNTRSSITACYTDRLIRLRTPLKHSSDLDVQEVVQLLLHKRTVLFGDELRSVVMRTAS